MSSPASAALDLEVPRRPLGDRLASAACVAAALMGEAVAWSWQAPTGLGAVPALLAWAWFLRAHAAARPLGVAALRWQADGGWLLTLRDGSIVPARLGPGTRVLRGSVVLHWTTAGPSQRLWLTRTDVGATALRRLATRLACSRELSAQRRVYAVA